MTGKLDLEGGRVAVSVPDATAVATAIFRAHGCSEATALEVARHLVDANLAGVESHGLMRALQYAEMFADGRYDPAAEPVLERTDRGAWHVDARGGIGIPAMSRAVGHAVESARRDGMAAVAIRNAGHTGRIGAFAEAGAEAGCLTIVIGGGGRQKWRQVAPYGGTKALLPTNPYAMGIPGGDRGPVVLDFATSQIAGGWIYAAQNSGARLPEGALIDREGRPTTDPEDYFAGGAILPFGGPKGYAMGVMAEMICEAMLGPVSTECGWLVLAVECARWREPSQMQRAAEEILHELRTCPPAEGVSAVEIPGERERDARARADGIIHLPERTWADIRALARGLGCDRPKL